MAGGGVGKNHVKVKGGQQKSRMAYFTLHQPKIWLLFSDLIFSLVTPKA